MIVHRLSLWQHITSAWYKAVHKVFGSYTVYIEQHWLSLAPEVRQSYTLLTTMPPFNVMLDLSELSGGERAVITTEYEFLGPNTGQKRWVLADEYEVHIVHDKSNRDVLQINDASIGHQKVANINIPYGPWLTRILYRQESGISRTIRFISYKDR